MSTDLVTEALTTTHDTAGLADRDDPGPRCPRSTGRRRYGYCIGVPAAARLLVDGEWVDRTTTYWQVSCFGAQVEHVIALLRRGGRAIAVGTGRCWWIAQADPDHGASTISRIPAPGILGKGTGLDHGFVVAEGVEPGLSDGGILRRRGTGDADSLRSDHGASQGGRPRRGRSAAFQDPVPSGVQWLLEEGRRMPAFGRRARLSEGRLGAGVGSVVHANQVLQVRGSVDDRDRDTQASVRSRTPPPPSNGPGIRQRKAQFRPHDPSGACNSSQRSRVRPAAALAHRASTWARASTVLRART